MRSYLTHIWHSTCQADGSWITEGTEAWQAEGKTAPQCMREHRRLTQNQHADSRRLGVSLNWSECASHFSKYHQAKKILSLKSEPGVPNCNVNMETTCHSLLSKLGIHFKVLAYFGSDIWCGARQILESGLSVLSASLSGGQLSASNQKVDGWMNFWHAGNLRWPSQTFTQLKQSYEYIPQEQCLFFSLPLRWVTNRVSENGDTTRVAHRLIATAHQKQCNVSCEADNCKSC